jgi:hypothetical protein
MSPDHERRLTAAVCYVARLPMIDVGKSNREADGCAYITSTVDILFETFFAIYKRRSDTMARVLPKTEQRADSLYEHNSRFSRRPAERMRE